MTQMQNHPVRKFWRVVAIAAGLVVVLMSGVNGALLDSALGNAFEFVIGVLFGLLAITVFGLAVAGVARAIRGVPSRAVVLIGGALLALWFLSTNSPDSLMRALLDTDSWSWPLALPDALSAPALASVVLATAVVAGLAALIVDGSVSALVRPNRLAMMITAAALAVIAILVLVALAGDGSDRFPDDGAAVVARPGYGRLADPTTGGGLPVEYLTYGAGDNPRPLK